MLMTSVMHLLQLTGTLLIVLLDMQIVRTVYKNSSESLLRWNVTSSLRENGICNFDAASDLADWLQHLIKGSPQKHPTTGSFAVEPCASVC